MAGAIVPGPHVVCRDEPLAGSGVPLMMRGRTPIAALQRELGITTLYATCSSVDAWGIADRIAVIDRGAVQQVGTPQEVFDRPGTIAVAEFLGSPAMNLVATPVSAGEARLGGPGGALTADQGPALMAGARGVGVRPHVPALGRGAPDRIARVARRGRGPG